MVLYCHYLQVSRDHLLGTLHLCHAWGEVVSMLGLYKTCRGTEAIMDQNSRFRNITKLREITKKLKKFCEIQLRKAKF